MGKGRGSNSGDLVVLRRFFLCIVFKGNLCYMELPEKLCDLYHRHVPVLIFWLSKELHESFFLKKGC